MRATALGYEYLRVADKRPGVDLASHPGFDYPFGSNCALHDEAPTLALVAGASYRRNERWPWSPGTPPRSTC